MRKWFISLNGLSLRKEFRLDKLKIGRGFPFALKRTNMWDRNPELELVGIIMPFLSISMITFDMTGEGEVTSCGGMSS